MIAISISFYTHWKGSEISSLSEFASFVQQFNRISGTTLSLTEYPASRISGQPDIRQMKPDTKKGRISGTTLLKSPSPLIYHLIFMSNKKARSLVDNVSFDTQRRR